MSIFIGTIHRVKELHSRGQRSWLWEFEFYPRASGTRELKFLATNLSFPGFEVENKPYFMGGYEHYTLGKVKRGGEVRASFIEVEGRVVDSFFRSWLEESVDVPKKSKGGKAIKWYSQERFPRNKYARKALVSFRNRSGRIVSNYMLHDLLPTSVGRYELSYENSGFLVLPVSMVCNYVRVVV